MSGVEIALVTLAGSVALRVFGRRHEPGWSLSPDGRRYLAMASGRPAPFPFALRWLLPAVCSTSTRRWRVCTAVHMVALPPLVALWLTGRVTSPMRCIVGGLLVCGLPGVWKIHLRWPVLVDPAAMTWAMVSGLSAQHRLWIPAVGSAVVAGCIKESGPVFAACYGWHPAALLGLLGPLVRAATARTGDDVEGEPEILVHPVRASRRSHAGRWFDPMLMLTPWGLCLAAPAAAQHQVLEMLGITAALAYGQVLVAVDTVRLYQWAAPIAILATVTAVPARAAVLGLVVHLFNPWAGDGL